MERIIIVFLVFFEFCSCLDTFWHLLMYKKITKIKKLGYLLYAHMLHVSAFSSSL